MSTKEQDMQQRLQQAYQLQSCKRAKGSYLDFIKLMFPDPADSDDYNKTTYDAQPFHELICKKLDLINLGLKKRMILSMPPRNGKTESAAKKFIPFYLGHHPNDHVIYATYGGELSKECGIDVNHTMATKRYQEVFSDVKLRKGGKAKDRIQTEQGGVGIFVGRGGPTGGKGAHLFIVDDLVKDDVEATSPTTMEQCWQWYNKVATQRLMNDQAAIIIIMTRWSDNDLIGRLLDPDSPNYDPTEAAKWDYVRIPALCDDEDTDPMGREYGEPLWPT